MKFFPTCLSLTIPLLLWYGRVATANPIITVGEDREIDLYSLCSKFPHNSRCKGYQPPIALKNRPGDEGKCSFLSGVSGQINQFSKCKVNFTENQLAVYLEEGKRLEILDDKRTTREITIPLSNIASFNYFESEKDNSPGTMAGAGFGLIGGLIGAAFYDLQQFSEIEIGFKSQSALESQHLSYTTVLLDTEKGVALGKRLEHLIGNELQLSYEPKSYAQTETPNLELRAQLLKTNECLECDLRGIDLRQADLKGANLTRANLERANLSGADLSGANLEGSNLRGANLEKAILRNADLSTESFLRTNLQNANLSYADLSDADLNGANLVNANLSNANLEKANLSDADVIAGSYSYKFSTHLKGANLVNVNLTDADLNRVSLVNADLSDADLDGASLVNADLSDADLDGASLVKVNLSNADLDGASLVKVNLSDADLDGTSLVKAHLNGANLSNTDLSDSNLCNTIMPDGSGSRQGCN
ncbi:MAG: pentapeptide repeat-containing protein [Prochloraceae cyanobacterium]